MYPLTEIFVAKILWHDGASKSFRTESIKKYTLTKINTRWEATRAVMAAKLTRLTHKIAIQLNLVAESCTIQSSRSRRPVRKFWIHRLIYFVVFWIVAPCSVVVGYQCFRVEPEDEDSTVPRNSGVQPPHYTAQQPVKPRIIIWWVHCPKTCFALCDSIYPLWQ